MQYITRNLPLTFQIKLSNAEINPYSGTYNFNVRNVQTNQQTVLTLVDISTLKNIYSKFTIDSGTTFGLFTGQNDVSIYDIVSGSTLIAKDRWVVTDTEIDNNIYFMQSDNNPVVYGIYTDAVPFTPIFTLTLLTSGVDVLIKLQQGSPNTESFDIWRKIGTGGTYINIGNDITSFVSYDNILNYNTEYFYKIRAKNTVGYSNFTAEQSINTANITGVTGSSYYTKSEINTYTGQTALLLNSKLNLNIFTGYTGTTVNKSNFNIYTGTTAPNTFLNKTACACDSKLFNAKSSSYYLNTGSTALCATTAGNALALCGCTPNCFLGINDCAADSAKFNNQLSTYYLNTGSTAVCATCAIGAKNLCGCVPASFLLSGGTAINSLKLGGQLPAYYLNTGSTITCAADSAKLNNKLPVYYLNTGSTALCATCSVGSKSLCGCVPASFLLSGGTAINSLKLGGQLPAYYLNTGSTITCAADSAKLNNKLPVYYLNTGSTAVCATCAVGSKSLCGCVPASFLLSGGTAVNSLKLGGQLPAYYLNIGSTIGIGWSNLTKGSTVAGCGTIASGTSCNNTFYGVCAGAKIGCGVGNIAVGYEALYCNISGSYNTAIGYLTLYNNACSWISYCKGQYNTAIGGTALFSNICGCNNTAIGYSAGYCNQTGNTNVAIGYNAGYCETGSNKLYIHNSGSVNPLIYGDFSLKCIKINGCLNVTGCTTSVKFIEGGTCLGSTYLGLTSCACDSKCLGTKLPAYYLNTGSTALCATNSACLGGVLPALYLLTAASIVVVTGTSLTLSYATHNAKIVELTNTGATTVWLPTGMTANFQADFTSVSASNKTFCQCTGACVRSLSSHVILTGAYNMAALYLRCTNNYVLSGNLC